MTGDKKRVIVFGSTGAIGRSLVSILAEEQPQWEILAATRGSSSDKFDKLPNVKVVQVDPNNKEDVLKATADVDIVYATIGFPQYQAKFWAKNWPVIVDNMISAVNQAPGKKLVFCDNLYAYGAQTNISPSSSTVPATLKTKLGVRATIRKTFEAQMAKAPETITVVGGSDFYGPYATSLSFLGDTFTKSIVAGKAPLSIGSATKIHDFCLTTDFANALYVASINDEANGKFWVAPHAIKNKSFQDIANDMARLTGTKEHKVSVLPGWVVKLLSPFMGLMYEMIEMLPNWCNDYTVDDSAFCETFGVKASPYEATLKDLYNMYKEMDTN
eukprot:Nitzschia sp. Nitz4//scaffold45_size130396//64339//65325//NITZ4_003451-RA/size130396-processed-gene-0.188-mRNA-1//1//CDS//3329552404//3730//frame0